MATSEGIERVFLALRRAYPDYVQRTLSAPGAMAEQVRLYERFFADLPDALLEAAVVDHVASSQWWPKVSELRERCGHLVDVATGTPSEYEAWEQVLKRCRQRLAIWLSDGHVLRRRPLHPMIEDAVRMLGGWDAIKHSDNPIADRARFYEVFRHLSDRSREQRMMLPEVRALVERLAGGETVAELEGGGR